MKLLKYSILVICILIVLPSCSYDSDLAFDESDYRIDSQGKSFHGFECTENCGGHQAGWDWAESNDITDPNECSGKSQSFIEGCWAYTKYNY